MTFNLTRQATSAEGFTPYIKYNAKAGRFFVRPPDSDDVEVPMPLRLAMDMDNIKSGWIMFPAAGAPVKVWDTDQGVAKRPDDKAFKRGFELTVFGPDPKPINPDGSMTSLGLREWCSNAALVVNVVVSMYEEWQRERAKYPSGVPIFSCDGAKKVKGAKDINFEPTFRLVGWVDRSSVTGFKPAPEPTRHIEPQPNGAGGWNIQSQAPLAAPKQNFESDLDDAIPF